MAVLDGSTERAPLLERSTPGLDGKVKDEAAISTSRGGFIVGSVGLLIFLQGMYHLVSGSIVCLNHIFTFSVCISQS
jgi:hypothetical protein